MRDFQPLRESGHDHFFNSFAKFLLVTQNHAGDMLAEAVAHAGEDQEQYLEIMITADGMAAAQIGARAGLSPMSNFDFALARNKLVSAGLNDAVQTARKALDDAEARMRTRLHCGTAQADAGCQVEVRYLYQVLRGLRALSESRAVIVNIDYPLGMAAYNILREVAVYTAALRGVYVLGKAATLNADVGDVMISSVVHDEHSQCTYWLDNAFIVSDLAADLRFGTGLDNQRAVTVKSTFLQNRAYLDFYYREAFTVVEMEAGPFCDAVYEIADADRHPVGEAVNFSKLPIDLGIIHYASDTPYTQARTLGARGLSYYGMDSTYASSLAILRRVLRLEGALR